MIFSRLEQPEIEPICRASRRLSSTRLEQPLNAPSSIVTTDVGRLSSIKLAQELNAPSPINVGPYPMLIIFAVDSTKACCSILNKVFVACILT